MDITKRSHEYNEQQFNAAVERLAQQANQVVRLYQAFINYSLRSIQFLQQELTAHSRILERYGGTDLDVKWVCKDSIDLILECIEQETQNISGYREVIKNATR
jgi:hypothetical protein